MTTLLLLAFLAPRPAACQSPYGLPPPQASAPAKAPAGAGFIVFSRDGRTLAAAAGKTVRLWDAAAGQELGAIRCPDGPVSAASFSPDGQLLVTLSSSTLRVWEAGTGQETNLLGGPQRPVSSFAFAPDGRTLASVNWGVVHFWSLATGQETGAIGDFVGKVASIAFSPDGRLLALGGQDRSIRLWDLGASRVSAVMRPQ